MGLIPRGPKTNTATSSTGTGGTKTHYVHHYYNSGGSSAVSAPLQTWQILVIVFSIVWFIYFCCCVYYYKKNEDTAKYKARNESTGKRARRILFKALLVAFILPYVAVKLTQAIRGRFFNKGRPDGSNDTYKSLEDQTTLLPQQHSQPQMREAAPAERMPPAQAGAGTDGQRFEPMRVPTLPVYQPGEYNPEAAAAYVGPSSSSSAQPGSQRPRSPQNV